LGHRRTDTRRISILKLASPSTGSAPRRSESIQRPLFPHFADPSVLMARPCTHKIRDVCITPQSRLGSGHFVTSAVGQYRTWKSGQEVRVFSLVPVHLRPMPQTTPSVVSIQPSSAFFDFVGLDHPGGKVLEHLSLSFREWSHDPILRCGHGGAQPLTNFHSGFGDREPLQ
jgi:hypothetical protein